MYASLRSRFAAAFMAVVYLALPGGVWGVRSCAHHDGIVVHDVAAAAAEHAPAAAHHDPHAAHGAPDAGRDAHAAHDTGSDEHGPAAHEDGGSHGGCSCLDACAAAAAPALPGTVVGVDDGQSLAPADAGEPDAGTPRAARPHFFLPLPNAPPVASR